MLNSFDTNDLDQIMSNAYDLGPIWRKCMETLGASVEPPCLLERLKQCRQWYCVDLKQVDTMVDEDEYYDRHRKEWLEKSIPWSDDRKETFREKCRVMLQHIDKRIAEVKN